MPISKVIYKTSAQDTGTVWMDATPATAAAADITAPKTAMLADGVLTTGTGSGGGSVTVEEKDVNFIDYDGTLVASCTKAEINAMTSDADLPENPSHTGLTAQGWNWTVAQLKAQLLAMPDDPVTVGQMYVTANGNTEIDVSMPEGRLSPILTVAVNGTITVDWGDNTTADTVTGSSLTSSLAVSHTYAVVGDYTISISVTSGNFAFYGDSSYYLLLRKNNTLAENRVYANCVRAIRLGNGISSIGQYAFYFCNSLANITMSKDITSIGQYSFASCRSLASIAIPSGVTNINDHAFQYCYSLEKVAFPSAVTRIGTYCFYYCYLLKNITIPNGVSYIGGYAFRYSSVVSITMPGNVTGIETYTFADCGSLANVTIPNDVTRISTNAFLNCYYIANIIIPSGVTAIGNYAFSGCYGMAEYHIKPSVVPELGTGVFSNSSSDRVIYVPYSADHSILEAYQTATNWSTYASDMQEEPQ